MTALITTFIHQFWLSYHMAFKCIQMKCISLRKGYKTTPLRSFRVSKSNFLTQVIYSHQIEKCTLVYVYMIKTWPIIKKDNCNFV